MAGENVLPVSEYPDDFTTVAFVVTGIGGVLADADDFVLFYAERHMVVDAVYFTCADANDTFALKRLDTATTDPDSAGTAFTDDVIVNAVYTATAATIVTTENYIPAGSMIALNVEAGGAGAEHATVTVQIRYRTRLK